MLDPYPGSDKEVAEVKGQLREIMRAIGTVPDDEIKQGTKMFLERYSADIEAGFGGIQRFSPEAVSRQLNVPLEEAALRVEEYRKASPKEMLEVAFKQLEDMSAEDLKALVFSMQNRFASDSA